MATTFGTRPEDTVADSRGNVLSGVVLTLYPSKADAQARTSPVTTVSTNGSGLFPYDDPTGRVVLWARDPAGNVWAIESEGATASDFTDQVNAAKAAAEDAAASAASAASLVNAPADSAIAAAITPGSGSASEAVLNATYAQIGGPELAGKANLANLRGNGFVALGDSISTAGDVGAGGAGYGCAWPHMVCGLSMQRLAFKGNGGVAGQKAAEILARVPDVIALGPRMVTVLAGTNDLSSTSFASWSASIQSTASQLRAAGIRVVLCTIPPQGTTTYLATTITWNNWLRNYALANGFDLLDFFTLLADPATGIYKAGYDSGDGLHPSQTAHIAIANYVVASLSTTSAFSPIQARLNAGDTANLISNPLLLNGSPSPTSWTPGGTASADYVEQLVTDTDFDGKAWEIAYTNAASTSNFRSFSSFTTTVGSGVDIGDKLLLTWRHKITVSSGITPNATAGLRMRLNFNSGTPNAYLPVPGASKVHAVTLNNFVGTVSPGTVTVQIAAIVGVLPVGANFTVRMGNFGVYNLTKLGLA